MKQNPLRVIEHEGTVYVHIEDVAQALDAMAETMESEEMSRAARSVRFQSIPQLTQLLDSIASAAQDERVVDALRKVSTSLKAAATRGGHGLNGPRMN